MDEGVEPRGSESIAYTHDGDLVTAITLTVTRKEGRLVVGKSVSIAHPDPENHERADHAQEHQAGTQARPTPAAFLDTRQRRRRREQERQKKKCLCPGTSMCHFKPRQAGQQTAAEQVLPNKATENIVRSRLCHRRVSAWGAEHDETHLVQDTWLQTCHRY